MPYLLKRGSNYYYNRRIPDIFRAIDSRDIIRVSLKTDSKQIAWKKAIVYNDQVEAYWQELIRQNGHHENRRFRKAMKIAQLMGFSYQPGAVVATLPIEELIDRVLAAKDGTTQQMEAVLGRRSEPDILLSEALTKYWSLTKNKTINKTADQLRKWKNPRKKAMNNFIALVGNKPINKITRSDTVAFRDWWIERIEKDGKNAGSANKDLIHVKSVLDTVSEHYQLGLDIRHLFRKLLLETRFTQTRLPFTTAQIIDILTSDKLSNLNNEARWFLFAAAETGARPSELAGLLPEDIRLNVSIPHIAITDRKERSLKTPHSQREIPLVGYALQAFRAMPNGFPRYRDKPDNLTNATNKFLRENGLLPSTQHSVYSFRHSFQDRILAANAPDRIQAELLGHKFQRPKYGDGGTLELKADWLKQTMLLK